MSSIGPIVLLGFRAESGIRGQIAKEQTFPTRTRVGTGITCRCDLVVAVVATDPTIKSPALEERGFQLERRRALMDAWPNCEPKEALLMLNDPLPALTALDQVVAEVGRMQTAFTAFAIQAAPLGAKHAN